MPRHMQFLIGGLGGLLPIVASLIAMDLTAIAALIDKNQLTEGLCVGYAVRIIGLFVLGGTMAALNSEVRTPLALVQIGIAAPALVTSYLSVSAIAKPADGHASLFVGAAHAAEPGPAAAPTRLAGSFLDEVWKGAQPGLGQYKVMGVTPGGSYGIVDQSTSLCVNAPGSKLNELQNAFPSPRYVLRPGGCG